MIPDAHGSTVPVGRRKDREHGLDLPSVGGGFRMIQQGRMNFPRIADMPQVPHPQRWPEESANAARIVPPCHPRPVLQFRSIGLPTARRHRRQPLRQPRLVPRKLRRTQPHKALRFGYAHAHPLPPPVSRKSRAAVLSGGCSLIMTPSWFHRPIPQALIISRISPDFPRTFPGLDARGRLPHSAAPWRC